MTIAERQAIADATENCRRLSLELADLRTRLAAAEERVAALEAQRPTLTMKARANG